MTTSLSMTGYGRAEAEAGRKKITAELRAVNSKQLDLNIKMPAVYRSLEPAVRSLLASLQRGKIDVYVNVETLSEQPTATINEALYKAYYLQLKKLALELGDAEMVAPEAILRLPDVVSVQQSQVDEAELQAVLACVQEAMQGFVEFRRQEGLALMADLLQRVQRIGTELLLQIEPFEQERTNIIKARIQQALEDTVGAANVDHNRFEQELIYYFERLDVTEEKTRLANHCSYFAEVAQEPAAGRKLAFIAQEMGREINTLGSKSNDSQMQRIVVQMKDELEKIKEQLLNIL